MTPRDRILARRTKFMAAALVGLAGCGSNADVAAPQVYLSDTGSPVERDTAVKDAKDAADTEPMVCLTAPPPDTGAEDVADASIEDSSIDDSSIDDAAIEDTSSGKDTGPMPCLTPPPDDP